MFYLAIALLLLSSLVIYYPLKYMGAENISPLNILLTAAVLLTLEYFSFGSRILTFIFPMVSITFIYYYHRLDNFIKAFFVWLLQYIAVFAVSSILIFLKG